MTHSSSYTSHRALAAGSFVGRVLAAADGGRDPLAVLDSPRHNQLHQFLPAGVCVFDHYSLTDQWAQAVLDDGGPHSLYGAGGVLTGHLTMSIRGEFVCIGVLYPRRTGIIPPTCVWMWYMRRYCVYGCYNYGLDYQTSCLNMSVNLLLRMRNDWGM